MDEKAKATIQTYMGSNFTDAIAQGTTQDTLTIHFDNALQRIAAICEEEKGITPYVAGYILVQSNPGSEYNAFGFFGMLGIAYPF